MTFAFPQEWAVSALWQCLSDYLNSVTPGVFKL